MRYSRVAHAAPTPAVITASQAAGGAAVASPPAQSAIVIDSAPLYELRETIMNELGEIMKPPIIRSDNDMSEFQLSESEKASILKQRAERDAALAAAEDAANAKRDSVRKVHAASWKELAAMSDNERADALRAACEIAQEKDVA
jgi:hypothetical protein